MMATSLADGTLKTTATAGAAICAETIVANFFDGAADLAVVSGLTLAEPIDSLAPWLAETEDAEVAEELMGEIHGDA
jgi:hypothetical protein